MTKQFRSIEAAIGYFVEANPARAKPINFFEPDRGGPPPVPDLSSDHPHRVWVRVCLALVEAIKQTNNERAAWAFNHYFLCDRGTALSKEEIAERLGVGVRYVYKLLHKVSDNFEDELYRRGLLSAPEGVALN